MEERIKGGGGLSVWMYHFSLFVSTYVWLKLNGYVHITGINRIYMALTFLFC